MATWTYEEFGELYDRWYPYGYAKLRVFGFSHELREELLQETAWKFVRRYLPAPSNLDDKPEALLTQILRNLAIDYLRKAGQQGKSVLYNLDLLPSKPGQNYVLVGPDEAKKKLQRVFALFPGADTLTIAALLQHGSIDKAAIALLEKEGLEIQPELVRDKKHLIRSRLSKLEKRLHSENNQDDLGLLSLFDYKTWDVILENLTYQSTAKREALASELAGLLPDYPSSSDAMIDVAMSPFNQSTSFLVMANWILDSIVDHNQLDDHEYRFRNLVLHWQAAELSADSQDSTLISTTLLFLEGAMTIFKSMLFDFLTKLLPESLARSLRSKAESGSVSRKIGASMYLILLS